MDGCKLELEMLLRRALIKCGPHMAPRHEMAGGRCTVKALPQDAPMDGAHGSDTAPRDGLTASGCTHDTTPCRGSTDSK